MRTTLALLVAIIVLATSSPARAEHACGDDDHDGVDLRRLAERVVAWRAAHAPAASEPSRWLPVKLLGLNDFHGALSPRKLGASDVGGAAVLAAYLKKAAVAAAGPTYVVHAGDQVGASPPNSALLQDEPSIGFLNLIANGHCGYGLRRLDPRCNVVGTPGNHEFDEGKAELFRLLDGGNHAKGPFLENPWRGAKIPYVASSVVDARSGRPILPPFVIKRVSDKVGLCVIGAVLKGTPTIVTPAGVAGLSFRDEAAAINEQVLFCKALGVRAVVVNIHQGGFQSNNTGGASGPATALNGPEIKDIVSRLDAEVDVVISGHSHSFTNTLLPNGGGKDVLVTQAFSSGTAYADIDLSVDPATRDVVAKQAKVVTTYHLDLAGQPIVTPDPAVTALVAAADAKVAPIVNQLLGSAASALTRSQNAAGESALGNLIADAQRWRMGTDFAFMNPGGIRADLDAGPITWGELFAIQPFSNDLVTMTLTGQQVLDLLAQQFAVARMLQLSGLRYTWTDAATDTVTSATTAAGAPLDLAASYTVTVNSFLAGGGDGFSVLTAGTNRVVGPVDLDALVDHVKAQPGAVNAAIEGRITRVVP